MPIMDGLEATRLIKERDGDRSHVVFCTAHAVENFRTEAEEAGGDGFISKPFNLGKIDQLIKSVPWDSLTETERRNLAATRQTTPEGCSSTMCL